MAIRHDTTVPRSSLWNNNHVGDLNDLDDVTITSGTEGDVVRLRSSVWVNEAFPATAALTAAEVQAVGHYELLMAAGISSPPEPLDDGTGTDWLYVWVTP